MRRALSSTGVLCTTGEHEYTRYGFRRLIADRAVDILQPDVTWCGGITEARRIVAQASTPSCGVHTARVPHVNRMHAACMYATWQAAAYDIPVIPHGSSVYSYHLQCASHDRPLHFPTNVYLTRH